MSVIEAAFNQPCDQTRALGLSLGDRCCLALAQSPGAEVVTADRPWKALKGWRMLFIR